MRQVEFTFGTGIYHVTETGEVYSYQKQKQLPEHCNGNGYLGVGLWSGSVAKREYIHRLVAKHFVNNPYSYNEVNHIDGCKHNNHYLNLEWCSHQENMTHAHELGLFVQGEINKEANQASWIGMTNTTRQIIGLTGIKNKASNYKVAVRCLCGYEFFMYHNDFKKDKQSHCKNCRPKSSYQRN